jgi:hypothetical protein
MDKPKHKPFKPGKVMSFFADFTLARKIRIEAARLDKDSSFVIRLALRKYFGLKETGSL